MCEVATIGLAISAVAAGLGAVQTNANNQTQKWALDAQNEQTQKQTTELQKQIDGQAQQQTSDRAKAAMRERAALRVAAGESGVSGAGVNVIDSQIQQTASADMGTIESNRAARSKQAAMDQAGTAAAIQSRRNELPSEAATWGQAALRIGGDVSKYYTRPSNKVK